MEGETWINAVAPRPETKSVNVVAVPRLKSPFVSSVGAENKGTRLGHKFQSLDKRYMKSIALAKQLDNLIR